MADRSPEPSGEETGLASVATVSFLASRAAPTAGFLIALAGGTAIARAAQRVGARRGYGASIAAMLESVAIMGPSRISVPFTQAITAPLLGMLEARGARALTQFAVCAAIRLVDNAAGTAFLVWIVLGGLDAYAGSYDTLAGGLLPDGETASLVVVALGLLAWAVFASAVQVAVYRRGLASWPEGAGEARTGAAPDGPAATPRLDPRAAALAAAVAFALLVASTDWLLLGGVCAWLALAAPLARSGDRTVFVTGAALAAVLGGGALAASLLAGLGADVALRRALRAVLLVSVATWLRAAAGSGGLREVFRRMLGRLRRLPAVPEAAAVLDRLASDRRLTTAGRDVLAAVAAVPKRPLPLLDAILGWVASQSGRLAPAPAIVRVRLSPRPLDVLLVAGAAALPALGLAVGG